MVGAFPINKDRVLYRAQLARLGASHNARGIRVISMAFFLGPLLFFLGRRLWPGSHQGADHIAYDAISLGVSFVSVVMAALGLLLLRRPALARPIYLCYLFILISLGSGFSLLDREQGFSNFSFVVSALFVVMVVVFESFWVYPALGLCCALSLGLGSALLSVRPQVDEAILAALDIGLAAVLGLYAQDRRLKMACIAFRLEEANEQLRESSLRDPLTGLHNRRFFTESLEQHLSLSRRYGEAMALLMVDIDNFKRINDVYGHQIGDDFLQALAKALLAQLRGSDVLARFGGEEFIVILPRVDAEQAFIVAEKLRLVVGDIPYPRLAWRPSVSIGAAIARQGEDARGIVARADAYLYKAKHEGRDRVVVERDLWPA